MKVKRLRETNDKNEKRQENDLSIPQNETKQQDQLSIVSEDKTGQTTLEKVEKHPKENDDIAIDSKPDEKESNPLLNETSSKSFVDIEKKSSSDGHLSDETLKNDRQPLIGEENFQNQNNFKRRGGSMRLTDSTSTTTNFGQRNTRRSFSTGRDIKSIRDRLESGSNTLRSGLSRFGSTVSLKTQSNKISKKTPKGERERLIFEEDPDESTDQTVRKKHEEKERTKNMVPSTPKGKRHLIGGQSTNTTSSEKTQQKVVIPTYKKLQTFDNENVSDEYHSPTSTPNFADVIKIKEEPTETYKKLSSSPTMQPKFTPIESRQKDHENEAYATRTRNEARVPPVEPENATKKKEDDVITDNNNMQEDQVVNRNKSTDHNPLQPQTVDRFASKQDGNTIKGESISKYGGNNRQKSSFSPLTRSFTWNSSKKVKSQQQQQDNGVIKNSRATVEGGNDQDNAISSPSPIRRSYSSRNKPRRKLDDQGRLLDSKGCAKRNILSSLSFLSGRKSEPKRMLKEEEDEEDFSTTNAKIEPQQSRSGSGKSGLFENSTLQQSWKNKQRHTDDDRQLLIEDDDDDDDDEDSCLDRTIQNNNKNSMQARDKRDNNKKNNKNKLGGLSLKKKHNL